jgi:hypothetical protein
MEVVMKLRSRTAVLVAASALTAAGATSALAFEHQFSGAFTVYSDNSNFNGSRAGQDYYVPQLFEENAPDANYIESRARLGYTAKANDDLKFVSMFELDYNYWGNSSYTTARGGGGALGSDTINVETKNLYLDANVAKNTNVKLGMMGFDDAFKGVFVGADMAGLLVSHSYSNASASVGAFRWDDKSDASNSALGRQTRDFIVLDGKYNLSKETKVGAAYYFMKDNTDNIDSNVHMIGVNAETVAGPLNLNGFIAAQFGEVDGMSDFVPGKQKDLTAFAASLGANMKVGKGTLRGDLLYASGDDGKDDDESNAFQSVPYESGYYANEMVILGRDKNAFTLDNAIVYNANNQNRGVVFLSTGYDMPLSDKLNCSANLGFALTDTNRTGDNGNQYLGTEINAELVYSLIPNVTLSARGAYVFLGDFYKDVATNNETPDDPYDFKLLARYAF